MAKIQGTDEENAYREVQNTVDSISISIQNHERKNYRVKESGFVGCRQATKSGDQRI